MRRSGTMHTSSSVNSLTNSLSSTKSAKTKNWDLDQCIYNYLVCEAENPKSYDQIFEAVTQEGPFQCVDLVNEKNKAEQYFLVMIECNGLEDKFDHLHTMYNSIAKQPYIMFSTNKTKSHEETFDHALEKDDQWLHRYDSQGLMRYMMDHLEDVRNVRLNDYLDGNDSIVHLIARYGTPKDLKRLTSLYNVDLEKKNRFGQTPIEITETLNRTEMMRAFLKTQFEEEIEELRKQDVELRRQNSTLLDENMMDKANITVLNTKLYKYRINLILAHSFWAFILTLMTYYFIF